MAPSEDRESAVHLAAIRRALARRNAAVMVGAGFSRNAEGGERLSTWSQLSDELLRRLDPTADPRAFSIGNVTQLGEQYSRVFSEPALEEFLKEMVPDDRVRPGVLHDDLLRLEWSEIFTTNYDTLLERAAAKMFERDHFTVCCREDIPQSKVLGTRRIVKLHGSFPSQRPFIFTEEHYRTYPERFAPFVNLVRQSLLENVFCLIGFSGDDPNFLHWLGWVRDMLDGASLPVYLFLDRAPAFGLRKLLEARGVTPVVLPEAASADPRDYAGRYRKLLSALAEPLERPALQWGAINLSTTHRSGKETKDEQYGQWLEDCRQLATLRSSYPGWLLAPRSVRQHFRNSTNRLNAKVEHQWVRERLETEEPVLRATLLSLYAWQHEVLLAPLDDAVALYSLGMLEAIAALRLEEMAQEPREKLRSYGITRPADLQQQWLALAGSLLRWARQGLRNEEFERICRLLDSAEDALTKDITSNERILLLLQRGQRQKARVALLAWKVRSADPYMLVRRAVLTAELGDVDAALLACNGAIQQVRASQKIKPKDPLLVSQEAWACLLTDRLQQGRSAWLLPEDRVDDVEIEDLSERLQALAARGYSPQRELEQAEAALGAEAMVSFGGEYKFSSFELGRSSSVQRFGLTSEFRAKLTAAFEWLELAERTGLLPRMPGVQFHSWSYLQAAWWIQYNDSKARVHGILMRTVSVDALKPKDSTVPPHKTGWLSRFQVALFSNDEARSTCFCLIDEVEETVARSTEHPDTRTAVAFSLEVFARLVVRIEDSSAVLDLGRRVIRLHRDARLTADDSYWRPLATALRRCAESMPPERVMELVKEAAALPLPPTSSRRGGDWFHLTQLLYEPSLPVPTDAERVEWRPMVLGAIQALQKDPSSYSWSAVVALQELKLLEQDDLQKVSTIIWGNGVTWPTSQSMTPAAPFSWPAPAAGTIDMNEAFVEWLRQCPISNFRAKAGDGFAPGWRGQTDHLFFEAVQSAMERRVLSVQDFAVMLEKVAHWWRDEGTSILSVVSRLPNVREALAFRLDLIDAIVWEGMLQYRGGGGNASPELEEILPAFLDCFEGAGHPLRRVRLQRSLAAFDFAGADQLLYEIGSNFLGRDELLASIASDVTRSLVQRLPPLSDRGLDILFDAICAAALARTLPGTLAAIQRLSQTALTRPSLLAERHWRACEKVLAMFSEELDYVPGRRDSLLSDDAVPTFRYVCAQLADALLRGSSTFKGSLAALRWIDAARIDPLPEMRFARYRLSDELHA